MPVRAEEKRRRCPGSGWRTRRRCRRRWWRMATRRRRWRRSRRCWCRLRTYWSDREVEREADREVIDEEAELRGGFGHDRKSRKACRAPVQYARFARTEAQPCELGWHESR